MSSRKQKASQHDIDHGPPVTRRDFITRGLMDGGALLMIPSILGLLLKDTIAEAALTCSSAPLSGMMPFVSIDCAGGAGLSGNLVVGNQPSGTLVPLASYSTLGLTYSPANTPGSIDSRFGAAFHSGPSPVDSARPISKVFEGIITTASLSTQKNTRIATICHQSQDDSRSNELNPIIAVTKAGLSGRYFKNGLGVQSNMSGGNSAPSMVDGALRPMYVNSVQAIVEALSYGSVMNAYPAVYKLEAAKAISKLTESQAAKFSGMTQGEQFQTLVGCGLLENQSFASMAPDVDPRTNSVMQSVYGITATSTNTAARDAALVYNALLGNSGPATLQVGGCDYHNSALPDATNHGDLIDLRIGQQIGRIIEAAARLQKSVFISVFSDGSVVSTANTRIWTGDSGSRSLALMVLYRPSGIANNRNSQLGSYTTGQTASRTPFFATNSKYVSSVALANYLSVNGQLGRFPEVAPLGFPTDAATLDSIIAFG